MREGDRKLLYIYRERNTDRATQGNPRHEQCYQLKTKTEDVKGNVEYVAVDWLNGCL